jgi:1-acyl-sn-glycerol-3-phosphate acyltransferase
MLFIRSLLFNILFYVNLILWMLACLPLLLGTRKAMLRGAQAWARSSIWLLRVVAGTRVEFRGLDKIPPGGLLVAAKHQSLWETFALMTIFDDPAFVMKRELTWIPLFGWLALKAGMISVNRSGGSTALADMNRRAREEVSKGRQLLLFPEGTRRAPGAPPAYKFGVAHLYRNLGAPCLPVALNSGLFWPRRQMIRRPGTITVEIIDPIPPGLPREEFLEEMTRKIEVASDRLLADGRALIAA